MIHLQDINKTYQGAQPLHVLKGISLDIAKGEFVSIMGASGSGKSTLLNILGILDNYDSGTYELAGVPIWGLSERKAAEYRNRMIGFIFQSFNLISFKTAVENVELPLFYQGVSRKKRHQMALEYLERLGLLDWAGHYPNELSGGQKQRQRTVGRTETACGNSPSTHHPTADHPGRRAYGRIGLEDFGGGDAVAQAAESGRGYDHRRGDTRERRGE